MGDRHNGVSIATSVQPVINEYDFGCKLGFLVLDNAASNDTCVQELGRLYHFNPTERRLRCVGHSSDCEDGHDGISDDGEIYEPAQTTAPITSDAAS